MTIIDNESGNTISKNTFARNQEGRSTLWFLTINNYDNEQIEFLKSVPTKYLVFQTEKGKKNTPHIHAVLRYANARSFASMKKNFPRANIQRVRNFTKAREYCMKKRTWTGIRYERKGVNVLQDITDGRIEDTIVLTPGSLEWRVFHQATIKDYRNARSAKLGEPSHWDHVLKVKPLKI